MENRMHLKCEAALAKNFHLMHLYPARHESIYHM